MFLKKIKIQNIRCISDLEIDLESRASANNSLVLLGNNGVGKSTILKCIALGLCDSGGASALLADMYGSLIRNGEEQGIIELSLNQGTSNYTIKTTISPSSHDPEIEEITKSTSSQTKNSESNFPWADIFVCGYGPSRILRGTQSYDQYALADAVYTLFNYDWKLQNPELVVRRIGWNNPKREKEVRAQLASVLMVKPSAIKLKSDGLTLREGHNKADINFGALADGHQSTINWVVDLMGWTYLNRRKNPSGIVLLDEVENHLHPSWQRHIMRLLADAFPRIQFIATSHSALCAVGIADKTKRKFKVGEAHVLERTASGVESSELSNLEGRRYDQVLESIAFETPSGGYALEKALLEFKQAYVRPGEKETVRFKKALAALKTISPLDAEEQIQDHLDAKLDAILRKSNKERVRRKK